MGHGSQVMYELRDPEKILDWSEFLGKLCTAEIPLMDFLPSDVFRDRLFWNGSRSNIGLESPSIH